MSVVMSVVRGPVSNYLTPDLIPRVMEALAGARAPLDAQNRAVQRLAWKRAFGRELSRAMDAQFGRRHRGVPQYISFDTMWSCFDEAMRDRILQYWQEKYAPTVAAGASSSAPPAPSASVGRRTRPVHQCLPRRWRSIAPTRCSPRNLPSTVKPVRVNSPSSHSLQSNCSRFRSGRRWMMRRRRRGIRRRVEASKGDRGRSEERYHDRARSDEQQLQVEAHMHACSELSLKHSARQRIMTRIRRFRILLER
jgi:hypothetical protein